ncbi:MAG: hypothetical protein EZS28_002538 [Streblomastix strix]|uniref:Uncharacterized protein n=1 Tax=Streblomastix strix TaxID=222440 RepID=A0A5J4X552_9EUKA|nr:MAG: hypothetical protein EZS28_002538 [Streblomastix strix]
MINKHQKLEIAVQMLVIAISTASGSGEEKDNEIYKGLDYIYRFLYKLNNGRNYNETFPPQPLLAHRSYEQIEEEGGNEEIDSQQINKGFNGDIKIGVNLAKELIQNIFIEQCNPKPECMSNFSSCVCLSNPGYPSI